MCETQDRRERSRRSFHRHEAEWEYRCHRFGSIFVMDRTFPEVRCQQCGYPVPSTLVTCPECGANYAGWTERVNQGDPLNIAIRRLCIVSWCLCGLINVILLVNLGVFAFIAAWFPTVLAAPPLPGSRVRCFTSPLAPAIEGSSRRACIDRHAWNMLRARAGVGRVRRAHQSAVAGLDTAAADASESTAGGGSLRLASAWASARPVPSRAGVAHRSRRIPLRLLRDLRLPSR